MHPHDTPSEIPYGYCQCGCGQLAPIAKRDWPKRGHLKGQPIRFISGHNIKRVEPVPPPNPAGLCLCGCGQATPVATRNHTQNGFVKGQPIRFIHGHNARTQHAPASERFWENVEKKGADKCWDWTGAFDGRGYGRIGIDGRNVAAHRFSYELHFGSIPDGMEVCHSCDRPPCCNPAHLWLGTHADNIRDAVKKGRKIMPKSDNRGQRHGMSRFTDSDVIALREEYAGCNISILKFAQSHNIPYPTMLVIIKRRRWKHLP